jgi:hypothetical protein
LQLVHEQRIQHEAEHLAEARLGTDGRHAESGGRRVSHADHQQPVRTQVNGGAQRRGLPHRTVPEVLLMQEDGPEQEGNRQARHQVLERELHPGALARRPGPGLDRPGTGVKGDRIGIRIAGGANADGAQMLFVHPARNALEPQVLAQQFPERGVVEQRARRMHQPPSGDQRQDPVQPRPQDADRIRLDHVVNPEFPPHLLDDVNRVAEVSGIRGERNRAHRAGGRAGNHLERAAGAPAQLFGDAFEHPHLIGRARPAARQHQAEG